MLGGFLDFVPPTSRPRWERVFQGIYRTVGGYVTGNLLIMRHRRRRGRRDAVCGRRALRGAHRIVVAIWTSSPWSAPQSRPLSPEPLL